MEALSLKRASNWSLILWQSPVLSLHIIQTTLYPVLNPIQPSTQPQNPLHPRMSPVSWSANSLEKGMLPAQLKLIWPIRPSLTYCGFHPPFTSWYSYYFSQTYKTKIKFLCPSILPFHQLHLYDRSTLKQAHSYNTWQVWKVMGAGVSLSRVGRWDLARNSSLLGDRGKNPQEIHQCHPLWAREKGSTVYDSPIVC